MGHDSHDRLVQRRSLLPSYLLLLLAEEPSHGYELAIRLRESGFELPGPGPVYRELRSLETAGLLRSVWSLPSSGPIPRVYQLTAAGRRALDRAAADLVDMESLIHDFHDRHATLAGPPRRRRRRAADVTSGAIAAGM
ncbi:MAG: PadR family transcriptional regulator, partial [Actinobacteria bacterium]|nr:PadR family transcriptional regulator [Actinomycetota bacterium]